MSKCLTDNQISAFVDGELANDAETFSHLNNCVKCFEQVTFVMNFVAENSEVCDQIDRSYDKMVSENLVAAYVRRFNRKFTDFINGLIPSPSGIQTVSGLVLNRYSVIGTAFLVAIVAVTVQSPFVAENDPAVKILIKIVVLLIASFLLIVLVSKINFPYPQKKIEKTIPNENFKVVK